MNTIIIETRGGVIQEIYSECSNVQIKIIDWDETDGHGKELFQKWNNLKDVSAMPATTLIAVQTSGET